MKKFIFPVLIACTLLFAGLTPARAGVHVSFGFGLPVYVGPYPYWYGGPYPYAYPYYGGYYYGRPYYRPYYYGRYYYRPYYYRHGYYRPYYYGHPYYRR